MTFKNITVLFGQSIFDIAIRYYGNVSSVDNLLLDNNLNINDDLVVGQVLKIRTNSGNTFSNNVTLSFDKSNTTVNNSDFVKTFTAPIVEIVGGVKLPIVKADARTVANAWTVQDGQSTYDIVLQFYNSLQFTEIFLTDNNLTHDDALKAGDVVIIRPELVRLAKDNTIVNNADYIDRYTGVLRIIILAIGNEINGNDGYCIVDVMGGELPYHFFWSNGQTSQNLLAVPSGNYILTVVDAIGDTVSINITITALLVENFLIDEINDKVTSEDGGFILIS